MHRPIVIVPACTKNMGGHSYHVAQMKYIDALLSAADCMPLILPACGSNADWDAVFASIDGVMLTGSPSNVHPSHFGQTLLDEESLQDGERDATTLPLIRAAVARGIPVLAICRGMQEVNVALGGSLFQAIHELHGMMDHRESKNLSLDQQYGLTHRVTLASGGRLLQILNGVPEIMVNSLHGQGVDRLAAGLVIEARADDGLIEACSGADISQFLLALQWHPEWQVRDNPDSMKIFSSFGLACRDYQSKKGARA